jgi:hypothetical protein
MICPTSVADQIATSASLLDIKYAEHKCAGARKDPASILKPDLSNGWDETRNSVKD